MTDELEQTQHPNEMDHTDMPVGEILRRTRVYYGKTLPDIEKALRIRASQIEALEQGDVEQLPGRVYAIGFIRSYAEYLGLDGDKIVHLFKRQVGGRAPMPELHFPVSAAESKLPSIWVLLGSAIGAVLLLLLWWMIQKPNYQPPREIPPVPAEMKVEAPEEIEQSKEETAAEAPETSKKASELILVVRENSWVEIKDGKGKALVARVLKAGERYSVPARAELKMSLGNAGGVTLELDGQPLPVLGERGQVIRDLSLDVDQLQKTAGQAH